MPLRLFLRPARRVRVVSAAIGRFDRNPTTQVQTNRPLQLLPLHRTAQPQQSDEQGRNA
jgi:hypothetical protein